MFLTSKITLLILFLGIILIFYLLFVFSVVIFIEKTRFDKRIVVKEYIKEQDYKSFKGLKREDFSFASNNNKLNGYIYFCENNKDIKNEIIIFVNGYHTTTENNIVEINLLASLGYKVYCYDNTGTGKSEGKSLKGTPQSMIDLQNCINYLRKENKDQEIILVGHSMGGNAVVNILNLEDIKKVISISPYNNITDVVNYNITKKIGKNLFLFKLMHRIYLRIKFKKFASYNTFDTLKYINTNVLLIHGMEDKTVIVDDCLKSAMENTNMFVNYLILDNKGHRPLLSSNAINYNLFLKHQIDELKMKYGSKIPENELKLLNENVNYKLKNELDNEVVEVIKNFLKEA